MKILVLVAFILIPGPASCFNVFGYAGGTVVIFSSNQPSGTSTGYFCRKKPHSGCEYLIEAPTQDGTWAHKERFSLLRSDGQCTLIFRRLEVQDAGLYQFGETGMWSHNITLKVISDPCCGGSQTVTAFLGETATIRCCYPAEFQAKTKALLRLDGHSTPRMIMTSDGRGDGLGSRASISDDRQENVFSVSIRNAREDDRGDYSCGVWTERRTIQDLSLFTEVHLHLTALETHQTDSSTLIAIVVAVCVCVSFLLTGGFVLIYKLKRGQTRDSASDTHQPETRNTNQNIRTCAVYQNSDPNQTASCYQSLELETRTDSVYQMLDPRTK
ncbi:polymeric immunoglobulin receptor-like isoform X2 [Trichomycterus rosablanca]|uniref:polymeric immunoglobulin receptor-like isoform X2 n=1 Tax=Trichomycterus rosablanca TaxID=2290929 RepID=UPI002F356921